MSVIFEFFKFKKVSQEVLFDSIQNKLNIYDSQFYLPNFSKYIKFNNNFSKKIFNLKSDYILLEILNSDINTKREIQGKIIIKYIKTEYYINSKSIDDYKNYIIEKEVFIKSNPLLDILNLMEGIYDYNPRIPYWNSNIVNDKINNYLNNAYIEVLGCYLCNKLEKFNYTDIFPTYFGSFNGIAKNYEHDISEEYNFINSEDWFLNKNGINFDIKLNNDIGDFQKLTLQNLKKINLNNIDLKNKTKDIKSPIYINDLETNLTEIYVKKYKSNQSKTSLTSGNIYNKSSTSSEESWSSCESSNSLQSNLCGEYRVNINNVPLQVLCLESCDVTLTELERNGITHEEWKSILFQICFGLSYA